MSRASLSKVMVFLILLDGCQEIGGCQEFDGFQEKVDQVDLLPEQVDAMATVLDQGGSGLRNDVISKITQRLPAKEEGRLNSALPLPTQGFGTVTPFVSVTITWSGAFPPPNSTRSLNPALDMQKTTGPIVLTGRTRRRPTGDLS